MSLGQFYLLSSRTKYQTFCTKSPTIRFMGPSKLPCLQKQLWFPLPPTLPVPPPPQMAPTANEPGSNESFLIIFSISAPIITHYISWILPPNMLVANTSTSLRFFHLNLSHSHLLPGPKHLFPWQSYFHSHQLGSILEQHIVSWAEPCMNGEWWMWLTPPSIVCNMVLIWSNLLKIKSNHDTAPVKVFSDLRFKILYLAKIPSWSGPTSLFILLLP